MCQQKLLFVLQLMSPKLNSSSLFYLFHFVCLQMWLDEDVELYDFAKVQPLIKKKQVKVQFLFV